MKVRRKAPDLDAVQFKGTIEHAHELGLKIVSDHKTELLFVLDTPQGQKQMKATDWILTNQQGHKHGVSNLEFQREYQESPKVEITF